MKNEAGDKSPNEAALSVLIEGEALTLVPLRSKARYARKEKRKKKKEEWQAGHPLPFRSALFVGADTIRPKEKRRIAVARRSLVNNSTL